MDPYTDRARAAAERHALTWAQLAIDRDRRARRARWAGLLFTGLQLAAVAGAFLLMRWLVVG